MNKKKVTTTVVENDEYFFRDNEMARANLDLDVKMPSAIEYNDKKREQK